MANSSAFRQVSTRQKRVREKGLPFNGEEEPSNYSPQKHFWAAKLAVAQGRFHPNESGVTASNSSSSSFLVFESVGDWTAFYWLGNAGVLEKVRRTAEPAA